MLGDDSHAVSNYESSCNLFLLGQYVSNIHLYIEVKQFWSSPVLQWKVYVPLLKVMMQL